MPEVTVIITTYKGSDFLSRAIDSVLNQTYSDFEIIIVDDNDPLGDDRKKTEKVMERYCYDETNKNGSVARNTGIKRANGSYIAFLDDDDFYMPDRLEKCVSVLKKSSSKAVYTSVAYANEEYVYQIRNATISGNLFTELLLDENLLGTGSNLFLEKEVVVDLNGFDERYRRNQDYEFMLRYFELNTISALDDVLVVKSSNGINNIPNFNILLETKKMILNRFDKQIALLDKTQVKQLYSNITKVLLNSAFIHFNWDDIKIARKVAKEWGVSTNKKDDLRCLLAFLRLYKPVIWIKFILNKPRSLRLKNGRQHIYIQDMLRNY